MNKGGAVGGTSGAGGPTAAAATAAAQKQKSLQRRVDNDIGSLMDNFNSIVSVAARVNDSPMRNSQEAFMMEARAARMVHAADSLLNLVSELKQTAIFSGFASLNDHVEQRSEVLNQQAEKTEALLGRIGEEAAASLKDLESHYYSSILRSNSKSGAV